MSAEAITRDELLSIPAPEISDPLSLAANPVVSVVMVTYNHEQFIADAIEGVLAQKCDFPIELLIGEDCSTDQTGEICRRYQQKSPQRIRLIAGGENMGAYRNFMRLWVRTRGKYLALCEGDDYWCDDRKLEKQVRLMETHPQYTMCFGWASVIEAETNRVTMNLRPRRIKSFYEMKDLLNKVSAPSCTVLFRNGVVTHYPRWYENAHIGDWPLQLFHLEKGPIGYIDQRLSMYRRHGGGVWQSADPEKRWLKGLQVVSHMDQYFRGKYHRQLNVLLAKLFIIKVETELVAQQRYGLVEFLRRIRASPVNTLAAGITLVAALFHVTAPRIYTWMTKQGLLKRMHT